MWGGIELTSYNDLMATFGNISGHSNPILIIELVSLEYIDEYWWNNTMSNEYFVGDQEKLEGYYQDYLMQFLGCGGG